MLGPFLLSSFFLRKFLLVLDRRHFILLLLIFYHRIYLKFLVGSLPRMSVLDGVLLDELLIHLSIENLVLARG